MNRYLVRIMLAESRWMDTVIVADHWFNARDIGIGQSPIGQATYLGSA